MLTSITVYKSILQIVTHVNYKCIIFVAENLKL